MAAPLFVFTCTHISLIRCFGEKIIYFDTSSKSLSFQMVAQADFSIVLYYPSHTRPGSIKLLLYEGVRDTSLLSTLSVQIDDLINSDIVLTSYDVLKEDLSHDSDRHEGDRRFMRFQKRSALTFLRNAPYINLIASFLLHY